MEQQQNPSSDQTAQAQNGSPATQHLQQPQGSVERVKLFAGQIPRVFTDDELRAIFTPFGNVLDLTIIRDKATGTPKGCCFVTYGSRTEADYAIRCLHNQKTLPGMSHAVQLKPADGEMDQHKLFVGVLPKTVDEDNLRACFQQYGIIEDLTILRNPTGESKGCAFVKFSNREEALNAINYLNGQHKFDGAAQPITVKFADTPRQKEQKKQQQLHQLLQSALVQPSYGNNNFYGFPAGAAGGGAGVNPPVAANPYGMAGAGAANGAGMMNNAFMYPNAMANPYLAQGAGMMNNPYMPGYPMPVAGMMTAAAAGGGAAQSEGPQGCNLFIYHLPQDFTDANLAMIFAPFGNLVSSKVFIDKNTGQSKCFGFVSYDNPDAAQNAIAAMNGFQIGTKRLKVQLKRSSNQQAGRPY